MKNILLMICCCLAINLFAQNETKVTETDTSKGLTALKKLTKDGNIAIGKAVVVEEKDNSFGGKIKSIFSYVLNDIRQKQPFLFWGICVLLALGILKIVSRMFNRLN
jgi:hypothetical protein